MHKRFAFQLIAKLPNQISYLNNIFRKECKNASTLPHSPPFPRHPLFPVELS